MRRLTEPGTPPVVQGFATSTSSDPPMFLRDIGHAPVMVFIVLIVVVLTLAGATYGIFTRRGSGIDQHPRGGDHVESPGVGAGESRMSGHSDENEGTFDSHGAK